MDHWAVCFSELVQELPAWCVGDGDQPQALQEARGDWVELVAEEERNSQPLIPSTCSFFIVSFKLQNDVNAH